MALKSWDQIQASPQYQQADDAGKQTIAANYQKAGGQITQAQPAPAEQPSSGIAEDVGNTIASSLKGGAAGIGHRVFQLGTGIVRAADAAAGAITGQGPSIVSTYAKRVSDANEKLYQQKMQEASAGGHETAANVGSTVGSVATDIGSFMIPGAGAAIQGVGAGGSALNEQEVGKENYTRAATVGGANYLAARLLPGATGEVAEGMIAKGIQGAKDIAKNAGVGAAGGAITGAADAGTREDATLGKTIGGAIEGAGTGAAFGGTFGAAHLAAKGLSPKTVKATETVAAEVPPSAAPDIAAQADAVNSAQTPHEKAAAYQNAQGLRSVQGSSVLEARGIPMMDSRLGYSEEAAAAHGKTQEDIIKSRDASREGATNAMFPYLTPTEAAGKMAVVKNDIEVGGKQLVNDMKGHMLTGSDSIRTFKEDVQNEFNANADTMTTADKQANRSLMADIETFEKRHSKLETALNTLTTGESVRSDRVLDLAADAEAAYNKLPDYFKEQFNKDVVPAGDGFSEGYSPVENTAKYMDAFNQLKAQHSSFQNESTVRSKGAVKGVNDISVLGAAKAGFQAFKARSAREALVNETSKAAAEARQLASGLANRERVVAQNVDNARAEAMSDAPVDDGTAAQMKYSEDVAPTEAPEAPQASPDQNLVNRPRAPVEPVQEAPVEPEPTTVPEPEPAPQPEQALVQRPRQPEAPAPEPVQEELPLPEPDQGIVRQPKRPETPVEEPVPVEAPVEPSPEPQPEPERLPAAKPKAAEKPAEEAPEPTPEPSKANPENASTLSRHMAEVKNKAINIAKKMFTTSKVRDKVNEDTYNNPTALQMLKREDVAENADMLRHAQEQAGKAKDVREQATHERNVTKLENWSKDTGIAWKYIDEAIKQKGLQKSKILGVNDIQVRATKAWQKDLDKAALPDQPIEESKTKEIEPWTAQRDAYREEVSKMHPDVRAKAMQMVETAFKASAKTEKPLTDSEVHSLWNKIYTHEAEVHTKAQREVEATTAKANAEKEKAAKTAEADKAKATAEKEAQKAADEARSKQHLRLSQQMEDIRDKMVQKLQNKDIPENEINDYVDSYMDDKFGALETPLSDVRHNSGRVSAAEAAEKYAKSYHDMNPAQREIAKGGESEETTEAHKIFEEVSKNIDEAKLNKEEVAKHLEEQVLDNAEQAFDSNPEAAAQAAEHLAKAYRMDAVTGYSIRNYPKVLAKAAKLKEEFPNHPALWLSSGDVTNITRAGQLNAGGLKDRLSQTVLGKNYADVRLMSEADRNAAIKNLREGKAATIQKIDRRRGALVGGEEKQTVTIKPAAKKPEVVSKPSKPQPTAEQTALKNQKAKVARMKKKLNDDRYWALNDDEYGRKWKAYQSDVKIEQRKLEEMSKKGK